MFCCIYSLKLYSIYIFLQSGPFPISFPAASKIVMVWFEKDPWTICFFGLIGINYWINVEKLFLLAQIVFIIGADVLLSTNY